MIGYVVAVFFSVALVSVFAATKNRPLALQHPLDDDEVPFPAAGQASTIFSLTALFGAYTGIFLLIGASAVLGLAAGSATALLLIRRAREGTAGAYEIFLQARETRSTESLSLAYILVLAQIGFAASELVFLRTALIAGFALGPTHATVAAVLVACIGYLYCLIGGYDGVFRTDVLQLGVILLMGFGLVLHIMTSTSSADFATAAARHVSHDSPFWRVLPGQVNGTWQLVLDFVIAFPMGLAFLLASPDAWKRVFIVTQPERRRSSFVMLLAAAALPFALITPLVLMLPPLGVQSITTDMFIGVLTQRPGVLSVVILGIFSCFLSAFNSALISAIQLVLVSARVTWPVEDELGRFRIVGGTVFLAVSSVFFVSLSASNPAFIATILMGVYAITGALVLATKGGRRLPTSRGSILLVFALGMFAWMGNLLRDVAEYLKLARTRDIELVPAGVALFLAVLVTTFAMSKPGETGE